MNLCKYYNPNNAWLVHCDHPLAEDKEVLHEDCGSDGCPLYVELNPFEMLEIG